MNWVENQLIYLDPHGGESSGAGSIHKENIRSVSHKILKNIYLFNYQYNVKLSNNPVYI